MNTYIQDKLDEFDEKVNNTYEFFNATDGGGELQYTVNEIDVDGVRNFIEQSLTDYHNHIVEKIEEWFEDRGTNMNFDILLSILQDTNPSGEYEKALDNHFPGIQDSLDKLTIRDTNQKE